MFGDPKAIAKSIVSKSEGSMKPEEGEEDDSEAGLDAAAEEMMSAFEKKDVQGLKAAMRSFVDQCEYSPSGDDSDDEF